MRDFRIRLALILELPRPEIYPACLPAESDERPNYHHSSGKCPSKFQLRKSCKRYIRMYKSPPHLIRAVSLCHSTRGSVVVLTLFAPIQCVVLWRSVCMRSLGCFISIFYSPPNGCNWDDDYDCNQKIYRKIKNPPQVVNLIRRRLIEVIHQPRYRYRQ